MHNEIKFFFYLGAYQRYATRIELKTWYVKFHKLKSSFSSNFNFSTKQDPTNPKCYLQCPATLTIDLLKRFLSLKLDLNSVNNLDIMYDDKPLNKDFTLMDIAYIYAWRRVSYFF